ncbi:MAG: DUF1800 family protein [Gemmatimonadetes bacterium]|nr:DUF1800 domain-containing protein [Gemmatimonadota bacterium]NIR79565.1 DUF1800 domain-containing protein [Gemmatimonadota bacterium]NIT88346.1 DUF1800 domain-containing protein [Gemmatimonadota bacterium]NIU32159.1 DUF1800 domain-containing protein [Gemmatimonadota bacterium]NIU36722.1 DUF1800 family protein [Gemmatimonadota bacterium]
MNRRLRALNRFGLGARIGEAPGLSEDAARDWLHGQLRAESALLPVGDGLPGLDEIGETVGRRMRVRKEASEDEREEARRRFRDLVRREATAALGRRVATDAPFLERLVAFWSNHLCVSARGAPAVAALAGHYERTAIRPHVLDPFEEMLLASARHPAMLLYLDNIRSLGPESRAGRMSARRGRNRGLNENYARELLELHTVGVDGGYDQNDVEEAARILTGWSADLGAGGPGGGRAMMRRRRTMGGGPVKPGFVFRPELHEPGEKTVMGRRYGPGGVDEGEALIRGLARHPSTADFLATKLARHFVADDPPRSAVDRLAAAYRESGGDLGRVAHALADLEEAWDPDHRKLRTPQDWTVAALRALRAEEFPLPLLGVLSELRQPLWAPPSPKGFDDRERAWADPDALMNRAELARTVARRVARSGADPRMLLEVVEPDDGGALAGMLADASIPADERFALALAGPAFQWR